MALDAIVKMRLGREQHAIYEVEAAARGLPLTTWLRQRLDAADQVHAQLNALECELAALRAAVGRLGNRWEWSTAAEDGKGSALLVEVLLLMRALATPQQVQMVQAELRRIGLTAREGPA